jgi:hypothetical protein
MQEISTKLISLDIGEERAKIGSSKGGQFYGYLDGV